MCAFEVRPSHLRSPVLDAAVISRSYRARISSVSSAISVSFHVNRIGAVNSNRCHRRPDAAPASTVIAGLLLGLFGYLPTVILWQRFFDGPQPCVYPHGSFARSGPIGRRSSTG